MSASTATRARRRRVGSLAAAVFITAALVIGPAAGAQAAIWPKGFDPKQYMLNVLGSMLAGTNPDGKLGNAKRAVIQADQQYDHSWEQLNELWKKDSPKNIPTSHEDYVIQRQKYFQDNGIKGIQGQKGTEANTGKGTKYVKPMKAPATKAKKLLRAGVGVGVGVGASVAWDYRSDIGASVSSLFGIDAQGAVCSSQDDLGNAASAVNFITGQDCDAYMLSDDFVSNKDAVAGLKAEQCATIKDWDSGKPFTTCVSLAGSGSFIDAANGGVTAIYVCGKADKYYDGLVPVLYATDTSPAGTYYSTSIRKDSNDRNCTNGGTQLVIYPKYGQGQEFTQFGVGGERADGSKSVPTDIKKGTANPARSFVCTYTMADGSTVEKESDTFKETDDKVPQPVCPAADPESDNPVTSVGVDEVNKDDGTRQKIYESDTTDQYRDWWGKYPECREGACALDLVQKSTQRSCFYDNKSAEACEDWMADGKKADNYQCMYGGHNVDLTECYVYGSVFSPEKVLAGQAYTDPTTGKPVEGQSSPTAAKRILSRTITDPQDFTGCLDNGWANANPVEWVMTPVMCSLQWAFAPSPVAAIKEGNKIENAWNDKPPGRIASAASSWNFAPTASGCRLMADFKLPMPNGSTDVAPVGIDACSGGAAQYVGYVRTGLGVFLGVLSFMACRRVASGFAGAEGTVSSS